MRLIVTEKDSAARKIAEILGGKVTVKEHGRGRLKVRSYHFTEDGAEGVAIGLRGHVMETVFPNTYRRWSLKYLGDMIETPDLAWVVDGGAAGTLAALRSVAKGATEVVIATDYDREGELIGHEALEILRGDALKRHPHDKPEKKKKTTAAAEVTLAETNVGLALDDLGNLERLALGAPFRGQTVVLHVLALDDGDGAGGVLHLARLGVGHKEARERLLLHEGHVVLAE